MHNEEIRDPYPYWSVNRVIKEEWDGLSMWNVRGRGEVRIGFSGELWRQDTTLNEQVYMKPYYYDFYLRSALRDCEQDWSGSRRGLVACGCEPGNEHTGSVKRAEVFWIIKELLAFREALCSMDFFCVY